MEEIKEIVFLALEKLPEGLNPFSHDKVYGTVAPANIPNYNFTVSPLPPIILNQTTLDFCTAETASSINTVAQYTDLSLVNYLQKKNQPFSLFDRSALAFKYGLVTSAQQYMDMAKANTNASINLQLLAILIQTNGDDFDPLYQMAKIKQIRGEWNGPGANLHDGCMALVKYGSLPRNKSPFTFGLNAPTDRSRNFLANWANWPLSLDAIAVQFRVGSFFQADGPYDAFDNIRSALWLNASKGQGYEISFGLNWRSEWTNMQDGIINETYATSAGSAHDIKLIGQEIIEGVPYIVGQNSWGKMYGKNGLYYFPRNVINKEFSAGFGAFVFKKMAAEAAQYYIENGININESAPMQELKKFLNLFLPVIKKLWTNILKK